MVLLSGCDQRDAHPYTDDESYYSGFREGFIESSTRSCLESAGTPTEAIKTLCECATIRLADSITREEMKNAAIGTPLDNIEVRTQTAINECRQSSATR